SLVANPAKCVGTNSVHCVNLIGAMSARQLARHWRSPMTALSCEIEGHPLGGGMLKIEPGEAARLLLTAPESIRPDELPAIVDGVETLRRWRHYVS
ncbi:MAG TPA: SAM-dependent DNA methyltransferase, partial [Thermoanaerobaculia bacterium]|nr:SAM-dependent DNA methyltransferase [Thermoanaerobaculia bacterium]